MVAFLNMNFKLGYSDEMYKRSFSDDTFFSFFWLDLALSRLIVQYVTSDIYLIVKCHIS